MHRGPIGPPCRVQPVDEPGRATRAQVEPLREPTPQVAGLHGHLDGEDRARPDQVAAAPVALEETFHDRASASSGSHTWPHVPVSLRLSPTFFSVLVLLPFFSSFRLHHLISPYPLLQPICDL